VGITVGTGVLFVVGGGWGVGEDGFGIPVGAGRVGSAQAAMIAVSRSAAITITRRRDMRLLVSWLIDRSVIR
jgi:hypothetical protein